MKLLLMLLAAAFASAALAEEREPIVAVELQCVTLPQAQALPLIARLRSHQAAEENAAAKEIAALLEKGTAKLIGWPSVTTRSGQRATSEQIDEMRYPSAYESGSASIYLTDNDGTVTKQPSHVRGADIQPVAKSFDTRNLGLSLQVQPEIAGREITISLNVSHVLLKTIDRWTIEHEFTTEKKTEKMVQEQPRFTVHHVESLAILKSGEHKLVGVFKTDAPEPTLELFILGAEILDRR